MLASKGAIIFDADDTLWETQVLYERAKERFYDWMADQGYDDREAVATTLTRIDLAHMPEYGFSQHRFPQSMRDTYDLLVTVAGGTTDSGKADEAAAIGYRVFTEQAQLVEGVSEVLSELQQEYRLLLYSVGDFQVQAERIRASGLAGYFEGIHIRQRKTVNELRDLLLAEGLVIETTWVVGNSLKSDINPALKLGLRGIWVQGGNWAYDEERLLPGRVWRVGRLTEVPGVLSTAGEWTPMRARRRGTKSGR